MPDLIDEALDPLDRVFAAFVRRLLLAALGDDSHAAAAKAFLQGSSLIGPDGTLTRVPSTARPRRRRYDYTNGTTTRGDDREST